MSNGAPDRDPGEALRGPWWYSRRRQLSETQRSNVLEQVFFEGTDLPPFIARFTTMMTMAVLIAGFGLVRDSGPVVIGAMLISPLTTPLMALCASLVLGQPWRQLRAVGVLAAASAGGLGVGALMMFVLPESTSVALDSEELLARTEPALLDLAVAIVAGAAGAYVLIRREAIAALPGVAIAVALVPPLTTVGITLELGRSDLAGDALLLYLTNLAGIVLAGSATMLLMGVSPPNAAREHSRRIKMGLVGAAFAVLLVALPLAEHTRREFRESTDQQDAEELARAWGAPAGLAIETELRGTDELVIDARGPLPPPPLEPLAAKLAAELEEEVKLMVRYTRRVERIVEASP